MEIKKEKAIEAYKVFNSDWTCRGFQYEVGKTYKHSGTVELCEAGFHACRNLADCFDVADYEFNHEHTKVAKVRVWGEVDEGDKKLCGSNIEIVKELTFEEVLSLCNSGNGNTGYGNSGNYNSGRRNPGDHNTGTNNTGSWNSGAWNSGYFNSGAFNSGNRNSGSMNSGNWNSGNWNSGYFNTHEQTKIFCFNKICEKAETAGIVFPAFLYFGLDEWVPISAMTVEEKNAHPESDVLGGYMKQQDYKEAFRKSFLAAKKRSNWRKQLALLKAIPNFDAEIFYKISGILPEELEDE